MAGRRAGDGISAAHSREIAETADDLRRQASDQLALGNQNTGGQLIRQAIELEDSLG